VVLLASSLCPLVDGDRGLCKLPDERGWRLGKLGLLWWAEWCSVKLESSGLLMGGAVLSPC